MKEPEIKTAYTYCPRGHWRVEGLSTLEQCPLCGEPTERYTAITPKLTTYTTEMAAAVAAEFATPTPTPTKKESAPYTEEMASHVPEGLRAVIPIPTPTQTPIPTPIPGKPVMRNIWDKSGKWIGAKEGTTCFLLDWTYEIIPESEYPEKPIEDGVYRVEKDYGEPDSHVYFAERKNGEWYWANGLQVGTGADELKIIQKYKESE